MKYSKFDEKRRAFLMKSGTSTLALGLYGCASLTRDVKPDPRVFAPKEKFYVDVHCHVFNMLDLDTKNFVYKYLDRYAKRYDNDATLLIKKGLKALISFVLNAADKVAEKHASFDVESKYLDDLIAMRPKKIGAFGLSDATFAKDLQEASKIQMLETLQSQKLSFENFSSELEQNLKEIIRDELNRKAYRLQFLGDQSDLNQMLKLKEFSGIEEDLKIQIQEHQGSEEEFFSQSKSAIEGLEKIVSAINVILKLIRLLDQIYNFTNKRTVNTWKMMNSYSTDDHGVSLYTPALVDFDYWVQADCTDLLKPYFLKVQSVDLNQQLELMSKISVVTNGSILPFVAYCPRRDVKEDNSSFERVKLAIEKYGFLGVKMYPPMGFFPFDNKSLLDEQLCKDDDQPVFESGLGGKIDAKLVQLYSWCENSNVPIMAHGNESMGLVDEFDKRSDPDKWKLVLERFPNLRINLGHFGGMEGFNPDGSMWALKIVQLMTEYPNLYADTANFEGVIKNCWLELESLFKGKFFPRAREKREYFTALKDTLTDANNQLHSKNENYRATQRILYGSDWHMLASEVNYENYLEDFSDSIDDYLLDIPNSIGNLKENFFGQNAIRYLGIDLKNSDSSSDTNIQHLKDFYIQNQISPTWLKFLPEDSVLRS